MYIGQTKKHYELQSYARVTTFTLRTHKMRSTLSKVKWFPIVSVLHSFKPIVR